MFSNKRLINVTKLIRINISYWLFSLIGSLCTSIPWLLTSLIPAYMIKLTLDSIMQGEEIHLKITFLILGIIVLRFFIITGYAISSNMSEKISKLLQNKIIFKWIYRDIASENHCSLDDVNTILMNDCMDKVSEFYFQGLGLKVVEPLLTGSIALIIIFVVSPFFAISSVLIGFSTSLISTKFSSRIERNAEERQSLNDEMSGVYKDCLNNMLTIKTLPNESEFKLSEFTKLNSDERKCAFKIQKCQMLLSSLSLLSNTLNVAICIMISINFRDIDLSNIIIIIQAQYFVDNMFSNLGNMWNYLIEISVSANRIYNLIDSIKDVNQSERKDCIGKVESLRIDSLSFTSQSRVILDNINFYAEKGEITVLMGDTGSGKSTLLKIIQGIEKDFSGRIQINSKKINNIENINIFDVVNLFEQKPSLFNVSIRDNILLPSDKKISDQEIFTLLKKMNLLDYINGLPNKIDTIIEEGSTNISGGENQKISLMRAFFTKGDILLFDEPSASLDTQSEDFLYEILKELSKNRIIIVVSHSKRIIDIADKLYTINDGKLIQEHI